MNPVILLEFNELTPGLVERFISQGHLPNFKRLRDESRTFVTDAGEREPFLEPWIQWVTVHSGLTYRRHGVFHLDEGHKLTVPRIWDTLAEHGHHTWICGSMNARVEDTTMTDVLPDPWCSRTSPNPPELAPYFSFVRQQVLEHTNDRIPLSRRDYLEFLTFMASHGLSMRTGKAVLGQLLAERWRDCKWQRVVLLDQFQFDVFFHYYRRFKPVFSTFFLNSTAHYQHAYWDSMEPEAFSAPADSDKTDGHKDTILFGYKQMDRLIGEFLRLVEPTTTLILCTALSQQPWTGHKQQGGGVFYRPKDIRKFAQLAGISGEYSVAPVMSEQFHLEFGEAADAMEAERVLNAVALDGTTLMWIQRTGARIFAGCKVHAELSQSATLVVAGRNIPFFDVFYKVPTAKSGMHHPDGMLWFRLADKQHAKGGRVPLTSVAPTLLSLFGVRPPAHMESVPFSLDMADRAPVLKTA